VEQQDYIPQTLVVLKMRLPTLICFITISLRGTWISFVRQSANRSIVVTSSMTKVIYFEQREMDRQTDRQTIDEQMDRLTDKQTDRNK